MTSHSLWLPGAVERRGHRRLAVIFAAVVAAVAMAAFAFAELATGAASRDPSAPLAAFPQFLLEITVPEASDVLPNAPERDEPEVATHGG